MDRVKGELGTKMFPRVVLLDFESQSCSCGAGTPLGLSPMGWERVGQRVGEKRGKVAGYTITTRSVHFHTSFRNLKSQTFQACLLFLFCG